MTKKEKAERIVELLKNIKEEQIEVDILLEELGIESCHSGLREWEFKKKFPFQYQVLDPGASKMADILGIHEERRVIDNDIDYVYVEISDDIAVMAMEGKRSRWEM